MPNKYPEFSFGKNPISAPGIDEILLKFGSMLAKGCAEGLSDYVKASLRADLRIELSLAGSGDLHFGLQRIADEMRDAVLNRYDKVVSAGKWADAPHYTRPGQGRLTGRLRDAVGDPANYQVSGNLPQAFGINFIDTAFMDEKAAHWRRLSFGTRGTAPYSARRTFSVDFSNIGLTGAVIPLRIDATTSPAMFRPKGYFSESNPQGQSHIEYSPFRPSPTTEYFQPDVGARRATIPTKGIGARNFFDAGLGVAAKRIPELVSEMFGPGIANVAAARRARKAYDEDLREYTGSTLRSFTAKIHFKS